MLKMIVTDGENDGENDAENDSFPLERVVFICWLMMVSPLLVQFTMGNDGSLYC